MTSVLDASVGDLLSRAFGDAPTVEVGGNEPLPLESAGAAWLIERGGIEVFCRRLRAGEAGRRRHLASFGANQVVFGVGCSTTLTTEGVALPSTRVRRIDLDSLKAIDDEAGRAALKQVIEGWVAGLFNGLGAAVGGVMPAAARDIEAGQEVHLAVGNRVTAAGADVVWVRHTKGRSELLGLESTAIAPSSWLFPVTRHVWLGAKEKTVLSCVDTSVLVRSRGVWPSLVSLHEVLLRHLEWIEDRDEGRQRRRLDQRLRFDLSAMRSGQAQLAAVLDPAADTVLRLDESQDVIFAASRLVAESMGVELRMPPRSTSNHETGNFTETVHQIGKASRVRTRRVRLSGEWWREDSGPLLALLVRSESEVVTAGTTGVRRSVCPVALIPSTSTRYEMVNPADGSKTPLDEELASRLDEDAFMFYQPLPEHPVGKRDLIRIAFGGRGEDLRMILKVGLAGGVLSLLMPIVTGHVFGQVIPSSDRVQLVQLTLALVAAALASGAFHMTRAIAILRLGGKIEGTLQAAVWDRLLALPMSFFQRFTVGDLVSRSLGIDSIRSLLLGNVTTSILGAVFSVFSFALLFYYQRRLALLATALVALLGAVTLMLTYLQVHHQRRLLHLQGRISSLLFGLIHGIAKLRTSGAEPRAYALWAENFARQRDHTIRAQRLANIQTVFGAFYGLVMTAAVFGVMGMAEFLELEIEIGEFLAFNAALGQFQAAVLSLIQVLAGVLRIVPLWERMEPILQERPEVDASKAEIGQLTGEIEFNHVSFRYHRDGPLVLDDVSFRARPGEFIALVGASGSGKSTCVRLLLSFEQPTTGSIYYDEQDLPSLDVDSVRRQVGAVLQDGRPMSGSILSNVIGQRRLTISDAMDALMKAGLEKDIADMPMGLYTMVSEGAGTFSAGQLQRLMIASAIVDKPKVLILDEATSALDNHTQAIVSESLQSLKATRIVIAHRLSTIQKADRIYVLDRGRVVETGTYDALIQQGGTFAAMAERQLSGVLGAHKEMP